MKNGEIHQSNFHNYKVVRLADAPRIDVKILMSPEDLIGGGTLRLLLQLEMPLQN